MCQVATFIVLLLASQLAANAASASAVEWRRLGTTTIDLGMDSRASGDVAKVWYTPDGNSLYAQAADGQTWRTTDFERWTEVPRYQLVVPELRHARAANLTRLPTALKFRDSAVSPRNPDEIAVASAQGVWRTLDGGAVWSGLNDQLPNSPLSRIVSVSDSGGVRCVAGEFGEVTWRAGDRSGWRVATDSAFAAELADRTKANEALAEEVSAFARRANLWYAGTVDGRLLTSADNGLTWRASATAATGRVTRIVVDLADENSAVAITASDGPGRVLRTLNAGVVWDDLSSDLLSSELRGAAFDVLSGAVYIATSKGVYFRFSADASWQLLRAGPAMDVALDRAGNQIYVAAEREGMFAAMAPHRMRDPRVVSAADRVARAAAPGSLVTVLGAQVNSARSGQLTVPILAANERETEIQVPFEASGSTFALSLATSGPALQRTMPLRSASPSIFVDRDGNALLLDGDSGLMLDAGTPARPGARVQILATGLGKVNPAWPSGLPAPLQDPPRVLSPLRVYLDREPAEVLRATLAPGYVGMYLVEIRLPSLLKPGTAELYVEAESEQSNRVRIWLQP